MFLVTLQSYYFFTAHFLNFSEKLLSATVNGCSYLHFTVQSKLKISILLYTLHEIPRKMLIWKVTEESGVHYTESGKKVFCVGIILRHTICNSTKDGNFYQFFYKGILFVFNKYQDDRKQLKKLLLKIKVGKVLRSYLISFPHWVNALL